MLIGSKLIIGVALLVLGAGLTQAGDASKDFGDATTGATLMNRQLDPTGAPQASSSALSANELAKEISNPVTSLWQLQFQFNNYKLESRDSFPTNGKWVNNLLFQPVLPVSLTNDWNLITRPVITFYDSTQRPTVKIVGGRPQLSSERTTSFGDLVLAQVLSPAHTEPWIFAVGPTWIFPTAGSDFTGQGKWQVGPAVGGGYITNQFMIAAFAQQWWSFAGDADRPHTNQLSLLPLVYSFFGDGWSVGYSGNILADWTAPSRDIWTVPLGPSVAKVIKLGMLPVQVQIAGQYFVARPRGWPGMEHPASNYTGDSEADKETAVPMNTRAHSKTCLGETDHLLPQGVVAFREPVQQADARAASPLRQCLCRANRVRREW